MEEIYPGWNRDHGVGPRSGLFGVRIRTCTASLLHALDKNDRRVFDKIGPVLAFGVAGYIGRKLRVVPGNLLESRGFERTLVGFDTQMIVCNGKGLVIQEKDVIHRGFLIQWSIRTFNETVFTRRSEIIFLLQRVVVHAHEAASRL